MKSLRIFVILSVLLAFSSCKTKKLSKNGAASKQEIAALFEKDYDSKTINSQLQIEAGGINARGDLRIIKDQTIYLSLQAFLGIEVARIKITRDSMIAIDRLNRRYLAESFTRLKDLTGKGLNFYTLQSLFTNRLFLNGQEKLSYRDIDEFLWKYQGSETMLIPKKDPNCTFVLNGNQQLKETILTDNSEQFKMGWSYSDFAKEDTYVFPHKMEISIITPKRKVTSLMKFAHVEFGNELNVECRIPSRYTRVSLDDILKIFSDL